MTKKAKKQDDKFEALLERLEEIVKELEEGELELEEALAAFEEGVGLSRKLNRILLEAQEKIQILVKDDQGRTTPRPFDEDDPLGGDDVSL